MFKLFYPTKIDRRGFPGVWVLGEKYSFTRQSESEAEDAIKNFKHKILRRLGDRDCFIGWKKTQKMLNQLKVERKQFRKLEMCVDFEMHSYRKMMRKEGKQIF
jgi:hypothetical protein